MEQHSNEHGRSPSSSNNLSTSSSISVDHRTDTNRHLGDEMRDRDYEGGQKPRTTLDQYDLELRLAKEEAKRYQSILPPDDIEEEAEDTKDAKEDKKGGHNATTKERVATAVRANSNINNGRATRRQKSTSSSFSVASSASKVSLVGNTIRDNVRRFMKNIAKRMKEEGSDDDDDYTTGSNNVESTTFLSYISSSKSEVKQGMKNLDNSSCQDRSGNGAPYHPSRPHRFKVQERGEESSSGNHNRPANIHEQQCKGNTTTMHKKMRANHRQHHRSSSTSAADEELRLAKEQARLFQSIVNIPLADGDDDDDHDDDMESFGGGTNDDFSAIEEDDDASTIVNHRYHQYRRNSTMSRTSTSNSNRMTEGAATACVHVDTASIRDEYQDGLTDEMRRAKEQARIFQSILPKDDEDDIDFCIDNDSDEEEYQKDEKEKAEDRDSYPGDHLTREETTKTMGMPTGVSTIPTGDNVQEGSETAELVSVAPSLLQRHDGTYIDAPSRVETQPTVLMMMASSSSADCSIIDDALDRNEEVVGKNGEIKKVSSNDSPMKLGTIKQYLRRRFAKACCLLLFSTIGLICLITWGASSSLWNSSGNNRNGRDVYEGNGTSHFDDSSAPIETNQVAPPTSYVSLDQFGNLIPVLYGRITTNVAIIVDSAQHQALQWIVASSLFRIHDENMIRQYYALAVLYYSFEETNPLTRWLKKKDVPSSTPSLRGSVDAFGTEYDICMWYGIVCRQSNTTTDDISPTGIVVEGINLFSRRTDGTIPSELGLLTNLITLDLSRNDLTGTIPSEVGQLTNLKYLDLRRNEFVGSIPSQLGQLDTIETINLSRNLLSGMIPTSFLQLSTLKTLRFKENDITQNVNELFCNNDTPSTIDYNKFQSMTELIADCASITVCEIDYDNGDMNTNIVNNQDLFDGNPQLDKNQNEVLENCEASNGVVRTVPFKVVCDCCTECNGEYHG